MKNFTRLADSVVKRLNMMTSLTEIAQRRESAFRVLKRTESRTRIRKPLQYSADGRRWVRKVQDSEITSMALQIRYHESTTPEWMDPNVEPDCRSLWDRELSENTWYESMNSGLHVIWHIIHTI